MFTNSLLLSGFIKFLAKAIGVPASSITLNVTYATVGPRRVLQSDSDTTLLTTTVVVPLATLDAPTTSGQVDTTAVLGDFNVSAAAEDVAATVAATVNSAVTTGDVFTDPAVASALTSLGVAPASVSGSVTALTFEASTEVVTNQPPVVAGVAAADGAASPNAGGVAGGVVAAVVILGIAAAAILHHKGVLCAPESGPKGPVVLSENDDAHAHAPVLVLTDPAITNPMYAHSSGRAAFAAVATNVTTSGDCKAVSQSAAAGVSAEERHPETV